MKHRSACSIEASNSLAKAIARPIDPAMPFPTPSPAPPAGRAPASAVATMCGASRPASAYCFAGESWSMKRSGSTIGRTFSPRSSMPGHREVLQHMAAEAADRALLDGDQHLVLARQALDQLGVERLGEARIGHRGAEALARPDPRPRLQAFAEPRAEAQDARPWCPRARCGPCRSPAACPAPAARCRRPRRADSGTPTAGRRSPPRSPPCASARARRPRAMTTKSGRQPR